ncbi:MAG: FG-GAP repeat protein, partial [Pyrinomonadaceae bacterium]
MSSRLKIIRNTFFVSLSLAALLLAWPTAGIAAPVLEQIQKITATPPGKDAAFGYAMAISGDTMVVGAWHDPSGALLHVGAAFVFVRFNGKWIQEAKLTAPDGVASDEFGCSVAISGHTIVVGARHADITVGGVNKQDAGAAYVFVRARGTKVGNFPWSFQQKLEATAPPGVNIANDEFGHSVAVSGNVAVVGAHHADVAGYSEAGALYTFSRSALTWTEQQRLTPSGAWGGGDHLGASVAISGNKIAAGANGDQTPVGDAGAVYVFKDNGSGAYVVEQKLTVPPGTNGDFQKMGGSIGFDGNTIVAGAPEYTAVVGHNAYGAAYVFEFDGANWGQPKKLTASDGAKTDRFGWSVAVSHN